MKWALPIPWVVTWTACSRCLVFVCIVSVVLIDSVVPPAATTIHSVLIPQSPPRVNFPPYPGNYASLPRVKETPQAFRMAGALASDAISTAVAPVALV